MAEQTKSGSIATTQDLASSTKPICYQSDILFKDEKLIVIQHQDQDYFLRITKSDKLILTK